METPTLKRVRRLDSIQLDKTYFTEEGYLIDHPIVTSVGIFEYTNPDGSTRRELRLPEDVFAPESLASYKGKPIIITHDAGYVDKGNVEEETIGTILSEGYQDGDNVRAEIIIHNTDAMKQCGLRELSLGYNLRLEETPGVWEGQPYDAIQRDIVINHLALVGQARAGEQARLNIDARDSNTTLKGGKLMSDKKTRKDGMMSPDEMNAAVEAFKQRRAERMKSGDEGVAEDTVTDTAVAQEGDEGVTETPAPAEDNQDGVQMVKDRRDRRDAEGDPEDMDKAMGVIAQQDEDIDTLLGIIDCLKAANVDLDGEDETPAAEEDGDDTNCDEDKPKENADRADSATDFRELLRVVRIGDRLNMDGLESMSVKNAKKAVLKKLKPSLRLDGKSAAYVNAAFDMAVSDMKTRKDTNYQRQQMMNKDSKTTTKAVGSAADARQKMIDRRMKKEEK
jgi:hypothetical protein|nr:MAG TPA: hypothetical protein [Caudoviricetes sp.]